MKRILFILICLSLAATACRTHRVASSSSIAAGESREGSSFETAVVIQEKEHSKGIAAEYTWLKQHYPGYKMVSQALSFHANKPYDILSIITASGQHKKVYFDISNFFGKF